jgi:DNA-binding CsgD family transcriptional regulator
VDWSYALLSESERILFRRLSVFAGGWSLDAAEVVCAGDGLESGDVLDLLLQLVTRSLVLTDEQAGHTCYRLIETLREYGLERLVEAGEEKLLRRRHLEWFLQLSRRAASEMRGPNSAIRLAGLAAEHNNLRAALSWSLADKAIGSARAGLCLATALHFFWFQRDHLSEGRRWPEQTLARDRQLRGNDRELDSPADVSGAESDGGAHSGADEVPRHEWGMSPWVGALNALAMLAAHQDDLKQADGYADGVLELARRAGDTVGRAHALSTLGLTARARGEHECSRALYEESLALFRKAGDPFGTWRALNLLGDAVGTVGDQGRSQRLLEDALALARAMGHSYGIAHGLRQLGRAAYWQGELDRASATLEESLVWWRRVGAARGPHWSLALLGHVALAQDDVPRATTCFLESLALCREAGDRGGIARCLEGLAAVWTTRAQQGSCDGAFRAARLFGAADALREAIGARLFPQERPAYDRAVDSARAGLGEEAFAAAWAEGRVFSLEEAVNLAPSDAHGAPGPRSKAAPAQPDQPLTAREREVAALIARGLTNHQIAAELVVADRTVDAHIRNILGKLRFASRAQVAAWAAEHGLTPRQP